MKRKAFLAMAVFLLAGIGIGVVANLTFDFAHYFENDIPSDNDAHGGQDGHGEHDDPEGGDTVQLTEEELREFAIEVGKVGKGELQLYAILPGEVVPNPDRLAHIVPRVSGIAREVKKKLGDSVRQGEMMAVIESRELADAKATYLGALERVKLARANFEREEKLWKEKVSSERDYLDAKQALAEAQIQLSAAEQKLHALGFSEKYLKILPNLPDESYTRYEIVAPFNGTIIQKHIALGEVVSNNSEIYEIADLNSVWVNLTVYQKDLASIRKEQQVVILADKIKVKATGVIDYVSPIVEESTRTATARVVLANPDGRWRPGIFVTGRVNVGEFEVDVLVPRTAIQTFDGQEVVFIQDTDGFKPQPVKIGRSDRENVEIISGLKPGQRYVTKNAFTLKAELVKSSFADGHGH